MKSLILSALMIVSLMAVPVVLAADMAPVSEYAGFQTGLVKYSMPYWYLPWGGQYQSCKLADRETYPALIPVGVMAPLEIETASTATGGSGNELGASPFQTCALKEPDQGHFALAPLREGYQEMDGTSCWIGCF